MYWPPTLGNDKAYQPFRKHLCLTAHGDEFLPDHGEQARLSNMSCRHCIGVQHWRHDEPHQQPAEYFCYRAHGHGRQGAILDPMVPCVPTHRITICHPHMAAPAGDIPASQIYHEGSAAKGPAGSFQPHAVVCGGHFGAHRAALVCPECAVRGRIQEHLFDNIPAWHAD